jgi:hypothetical protein
MWRAQGFDRAILGRQVSSLRTLDVLHLAALRRVGPGIPLLSFDVRQAQAARALGSTVLGA